MFKPTSAQPNVGEALKTCIDASRRLVIDRLELLEYDLKASIEETLRRGARYSLAGLFALAGTVALTVALGLELSAHMSPAAAAGIVGVLLLTLAGALWPRYTPGVHQRHHHQATARDNGHRGPAAPAPRRVTSGPEALS